MLAGIQITEIEIGTGPAAARGQVVFVHFRGYRPQGQEVLSSYTLEHPQRVHLGKRESIIGLELGIEGMRVGGRRRLEITSELAGGRVAADETLRVEVELLEVREAGEQRPEDYPPRKWVSIVRPGEAARGLCRWQFNIGEAGGGGFVLRHPQPGVSWRHIRSKSVRLHFEPAVAQAIIASVCFLPKAFPQECLSNDETWADSSEKANSISRDRRTNTLCLTMGVQERGQRICDYRMRENSPALLQSEFFQIVNLALERHLQGKPAAPPPLAG